MIEKFIQIEHHGARVWANRELAGKHREHCLCYSCSKFKPGDISNCGIARRLYFLCVEEGLVTPVYECPCFKPIMEDEKCMKS